MSPPDDLLQVIHVVAGVLDGLGVGYAFGGAVAQNFWGTVRATADIDVLVAVPRIRFEDLRRGLSEAGFTARDEAGRTVPLSVERFIAEERDRHLFVVYRGLVKVELFLPFFPLQHSILRRAVMLNTAEREIPVTTAEDLIVLKMAFHREKDLRDVCAILWNQKGRLDLAYIRAWAASTLSEPHRQELDRLINEYAS